MRVSTRKTPVPTRWRVTRRNSQLTKPATRCRAVGTVHIKIDTVIKFDTVYPKFDEKSELTRSNFFQPKHCIQAVPFQIPCPMCRNFSFANDKDPSRSQRKSKQSRARARVTASRCTCANGEQLKREVLVDSGQEPVQATARQTDRPLLCAAVVVIHAGGDLWSDDRSDHGCLTGLVLARPGPRRLECEE
jgi:hypothetical protein